MIPEIQNTRRRRRACAVYGAGAFFFAGGRTLCFDAAREGDAIGHWHDEIELLYVTEGSMVYNVNGTRCTVHEGEGIFINTRQLHFFEESRCTYRCVLLHPMMLCANTYLEETYITPVTKNAAFPCCILKPEKEKSGGALALIEALFDEADKHNLLRLQSLSRGVGRDLPAGTEARKHGFQSSRLSAVKHDAPYTAAMRKADAGRDCGRGACMQKRVRKAVSHVSALHAGRISSAVSPAKGGGAPVQNGNARGADRVGLRILRARAILPGASKNLWLHAESVPQQPQKHERKNAKPSRAFSVGLGLHFVRITGLSA